MNETWSEYFHMLADPAHWLFEMTFFVVEFMVIYVLVSYVRSKILSHLHRDVSHKGEEHE